jgi:hypothetical protein
MSVIIPITAYLDILCHTSYASQILHLLSEGEDDLFTELMSTLTGDVQDKHKDLIDRTVKGIKDVFSTAHLYDYVMIAENMFRISSLPSTDPSTAQWELLSTFSVRDASIDEIEPYPEYAYYYRRRLKTCGLYKCAINGLPYPAFDGVPLEQCQATAQPTRLIPDLHYKILSYNLDLTLHLPLSDKSRVLKEVIGYTLPAHKIAKTLELLRKGDWEVLRETNDLKDYYSKKYSVEEYCAKDILWKLNRNIRSLNYQVFVNGVTKAIKRYRVSGDAHVLAYEIVSLLYQKIHYPVSMTLHEMRGDIDRFEYQVEVDDMRTITEMINEELKEKLALVA